MNIDKSVLNNIRAELLQLQGKLKNELSGELQGAFKGDMDSLEKGGMDRGDESMAETESHLKRSNLNRHSVELDAINRALHRIDNGGYGICGRCSSEISEARLLANPIATLCIDCQSLAEDRQDERDATPSL